MDGEDGNVLKKVWIWCPQKVAKKLTTNSLLCNKYKFHILSVGCQEYCMCALKYKFRFLLSFDLETANLA